MDGLDWKRWRKTRLLVLERDGYRCTASYHDTDRCHGALHVHHADPDADPYDPDELYTVCARHHVKWERLMRQNELRMRTAA